MEIFIKSTRINLLCCDWFGRWNPLLLYVLTLTGVYGDVHRVKILFNKKDNALVQMAEPHQAQLGRCRHKPHPSTPTLTPHPTPFTSYHLDFVKSKSPKISTFTNIWSFNVVFLYCIQSYFSSFYFCHFLVVRYFNLFKFAWILFKRSYLQFSIRPSLNLSTVNEGKWLKKMGLK